MSIHKRRYEISAYADDVAKVTIELADAEVSAVVRVFGALKAEQVAYAPSFSMREVDATGDTIRTVIAL